ncbi:MAG: DUF1697 domain-containing protein [Proteobacteria bacterium]|nr:DUF1697 domain-containing protein [Pseudomonadota bacterium]
MPRYVAFLRGVSPMNAKMPELKACFEAIGFGDVKTVLSSGNVVFDGPQQSEATLIAAITGGMTRYLARSFPVVLRSSAHLRALLDADPFAGFRIAANAKRVVTFLGEPHRPTARLPIEHDGARILALKGREAFTAYVANERGPVFMTLIEKTFGKAVTTRTLDTVAKCAVA